MGCNTPGSCILTPDVELEFGEHNLFLYNVFPVVLGGATASLFQDFRMVRNGIPVATKTLETNPGTHRTNYPRRTTFLPTSLRVGTWVSISALRKEDADFEVTMAQSTKL